MVATRRVTAPSADAAAGLGELLRDTVGSGASVGFLWPLDGEKARAYWREVFGALDDDHCLWIAESGHEIVGAVQLCRCAKENGRHRAEIQKLFVHSAWRGRGIAAQLLAAAEGHARAIGCTLLVLDTEVGSAAESVYRRLGWRKAGEIPSFALTPDGRMHATGYHYKVLGPQPEMRLVRPAMEHLPSYVTALNAGWCADNVRKETLREELAAIEKDASAFVASQFDREARGPPVKLPDGSEVARIPGYRLWMWDGEFCGTIGFRWQPGTTALPAHVLGHIGYSVVPWKRNLGYAKRALAMMLDNARREALGHVDLTTDPDNVASQRTIVANGGVLVERFKPLPAYGGGDKLRYRIALA
jgi:predicted acetyltransferase/ribosomal protein S18 acetylase RimI-like enzyme